MHVDIDDRPALCAGSVTPTPGSAKAANALPLNFKKFLRCMCISPFDTPRTSVTIRAREIPDD